MDKHYNDSESPTFEHMKKLQKNPSLRAKLLLDQIKERDVTIDKLANKLLEMGVNPWAL